MISALTVVVPEHRLKLEGLSDIFSVEQVENFQRVTGIKSVGHFGGELVDAAVVAAKDAFKKADVEKGDCAGIVYVTQSPTRTSPCMAMKIAEALGITDVPTFDVNQSCTGFVYGLYLARRMLGFGEWVMVICADSLRAAESDTASMIFSDGACAAVVRSNSMIRTRFLNDPTKQSALYCPTGGVLMMNGGAVFDATLKLVPKEIDMFLMKHFACPEFMVQHQPNRSMMEMVEKRCSFKGPSLKSIGEFGNMSMVSIPATIAENEIQILGKRGLLVGYGAGFSVAITGVLWSEKPICNIIKRG